MSTPTIKQKLGCWLTERWQTEFVLTFPGISRRFGFNWCQLRNRKENIEVDHDTGGVSCKWKDSSPLTVSRFFPSVGRRLLKHCLTAWPIRLDYSNEKRTSDTPTASIIIAIGGVDRLRQLELVIASLRGQQNASFEIIVIEQSPAPLLSNQLPKDVRYVHTPYPASKEFNKSRALNLAARMATGRVLLIHDADLVVPCDYVTECIRTLKLGDSARPARFIFYLDQPSTAKLLSNTLDFSSSQVKSVVQNTPMPLAVLRSTYWDVGGHDETFEGWGGEDVEFLSRIRTRKCIEAGWLPIIHLWHPPALKKANGNRNTSLQNELLERPAEERINTLTATSTVKQK